MRCFRLLLSFLLRTTSEVSLSLSNIAKSRSCFSDQHYARIIVYVLLCGIFFTLRIARNYFD